MWLETAVDDKARGAILHAAEGIVRQLTILETLLESTKVGIALYSPRHELVYANRNYQRLLDLPDDLCQTGLPLENVIRFATERGYHGRADVEDFVRRRLDGLRQRQRIGLVLRIPGRGFVEVSGSYLEDGGIVFTYRDVTASRTNARALKSMAEEVVEHSDAVLRKNREMESIIEHVPQGITLWDREFRLITCNRNYLRMMNLSDSFKNSRISFDEALHYLYERGEYGEIDAGQHISQRIAALRRGQADQYLTRFRRTNPRGMTFEVTETPLPGGGFVATHTDLTESVKLESQLHELMSAVSSEQARAAFLSQMSHDIRTPLNAIIGFAELMSLEMMGELLPVYRQYVRNILDSGRFMQKMIADLLDLSRLEAGNFPLRFADTDVRALVQQAVMMLGQQAAEAGVAVISAGGEPMPVRSDERACLQVLLNVIGNAIKYTGAGGRVTIVLGLDEDAVWVRINDTGRGIAAHDLKRVFEPFFRGQGGISDPTLGVGLGLAICRKLMGRLGGTITLESAVGVGTKVLLRFPLSGETADPASA